MTQINLFLSKPDEAALLEFIRSKGGYLARDFGLKGETLVEHAATFEIIPETRLFLVAEEAFPQSELGNGKWRIEADYGALGTRSQFAGPKILYEPFDKVVKDVLHSRLWAGFSSVTFYGPPPFAGGPPEGYPNGHEDKAKLMMKLYNAIGRYVRKNWTPHGTGSGATRCGPNAVPMLVAEGWLEKVQ